MEKKFIINNKNVNKFVNYISKWIKEYVQKANTKGCVLGMSGGVDCSVVARLCQLANIYVHLIFMPCGKNITSSKSYLDSMELIKTFKFDYHIFNIKSVVDNIEIQDGSEIIKNAIESNIELARANIKPRVRMTYLYQYAQINNLLVIGTSNLSERIVGYFTKWGDGGCDLNPLGMITKREVYILAKYLEIPEVIINKIPSADLWEGQTDEGDLGISYDKIDNFILKGTSGNKKFDDLIKTKTAKAKHKLNQVPIFNR